jgi:uncharacterized protein with NAD-binding domain and iron-sulfur cluster
MLCMPMLCRDWELSFLSRLHTHCLPANVRPPAGREQVVRADAYVAALDVPGAQRLLPQDWRRFPEFDNIYKLVGVPVITVQLR